MHHATALDEHRQSGPGTDLPTLVREAWEVGKSIDLGKAVYGRAIRRGVEVVLDKPSTYYPFLAGFVRVTRSRFVVELGTNCGGSALAMRSGFAGPGEIVTVDLTDHSDAYLRDDPAIRKIRGDANSIEVIEAVVEIAGGRAVDMIYIDAAHSCMPTLLNYCLYGALLAPRFILIDDITLYPSMERMWRLVLRTRGSDCAVNAAEIVPEIRPQKPAPGFGVVAFAPLAPN